MRRPDGSYVSPAEVQTLAASCRLHLRAGTVAAGGGSLCFAVARLPLQTSRRPVQAACAMPAHAISMHNCNRTPCNLCWTKATTVAPRTTSMYCYICIPAGGESNDGRAHAPTHMERARALTVCLQRMQGRGRPIGGVRASFGSHNSNEVCACTAAQEPGAHLPQLPLSASSGCGGALPVS